MSLSALGWSAALDAAFLPHAAAGLMPARVALHHKHAYELLSDSAELTATCTGKLLHDAPSSADLPAVGDWVAIRPRPHERHADIHAVLPRRTKFSRRAAGDTAVEQIVAANVDNVLLVTALDQNYNLRRIERYLTVAKESGAHPVVALNKADLHPDPASVVAAVTALAAGTPVVALSALAPHELTSTLAPWLHPGHTLAFLGSSGVGKSTLINRLLGHDRQLTGAVSAAVNKGRHTTTHRELIVAPGGFVVIDTPGMRELQLWDTTADTLDATFSDIAALAHRCRFHDCSHHREPGCTIRAALDRGVLGLDRWQSYQKLQREQAYAARKADPRLDRANKAQ